MIFTVTLTKHDAQKMHPDRLELLKQAGQMINQAFAHPQDPTPSGEFRRASQAITAHYFPDDESTLS